MFIEQVAHDGPQAQALVGQDVLAVAVASRRLRTALAYCVAIAALVAMAAGSLMLRSRGPAASQRTS